MIDTRPRTAAQRQKIEEARQIAAYERIIKYEERGDVAKLARYLLDDFSLLPIEVVGKGKTAVRVDRRERINKLREKYDVYNHESKEVKPYLTKAQKKIIKRKIESLSEKEADRGVLIMALSKYLLFGSVLIVGVLFYVILKLLLRTSKQPLPEAPTCGHISSFQRKGQ